MALAAEGLYFTYPKTKRAVLQGCSVSFPAGEISALTGANGCGKTTLAGLLVGILKPQQGKVWLDDTDIACLSLAEMGRKVGYVMQNPAQQLFCTSVWEEMVYGLKNMGLNQHETENRVNFYLEYFGLSKYKNSFPMHLSQGEKQRLVLAAVLAMRPQYLLLDEPTASLDIYHRRLLGELLRKVVLQQGCGIVVVSHDVEFVKRYAAAEMHMQGVVR